METRFISAGNLHTVHWNSTNGGTPKERRWQHSRRIMLHVPRRFGDWGRNGVNAMWIPSWTHEACLAKMERRDIKKLNWWKHWRMCRVGMAPVRSRHEGIIKYFWYRLAFHPGLPLTSIINMRLAEGHGPNDPTHPMKSNWNQIIASKALLKTAWECLVSCFWNFSTNDLQHPDSLASSTLARLLVWRKWSV